MTSEPDPTLSRFIALLKELGGARLASGEHPNKELVEDVQRLIGELKGMFPQWEPIETAPRDGTRVLAYVPEYSDIPIVAAYSLEDQVWMTTHFEWLTWAPTHWMPLPEGPKGEQK
jgi:hypothetical protein